MKSLENLNKRLISKQAKIDNINRKIQMYEGRLENSLNKLRKVTKNNDITIENYEDFSKDYFLETESIYWNQECIESNNKELRYATRELEQIKGEIEEVESIINNKKVENAKLEKIFESTLQEFKTLWFNKMITWHTSHYNHMISIKSNILNKKAQATRISTYYTLNYNRLRRSFAEGKRTKYAKLLMDKAYKYSTLEDYINKINEELNIEWNNSIKKLADKCKTFNVDEETVKAFNPEVTEKGFEVIITDKYPRLINARIILAAENSLYVSPHTRYIVTQKKN